MVRLGIWLWVSLLMGWVVWCNVDDVMGVFVDDIVWVWLDIFILFCL